MSSSLKRSWSDRSCQTRIQKCWFPVKVYWDTGRLGMKLVEQDGVLVVRRTQKGTWADEMKLRIGDELVSINGQAVSQMREEDCRDTLLWRRPLRLTFARLCRASATPRLRNRTAARLDEALSFSQSQLQLQDAPLPEVVRSRAESLEVRADEVGEDRAVDAVVTALLHTLEDPEKKQEIQSNARTEDPMHELAAEVHEEDTQITDPAEPAKPIGLIEPEPSQPSEPADPTLLADVESREPRERQYSDFEEFENDEPSEYEDVFEIDDEENTPANKESGKSSNPESGYPGTTPAIAAPSMANLETEASHERRVVFAETREDLNIVLEGRIGQGDTNAQANHPSLEKKVSFSDDAGVDSATAKAMRKGTGFVSQEDLPDSEDDEEDETDEIQAPPGCGERKVSFSQEAGTDSEQVQAMRKGTGFVPMRDLPDSDDEDPEDQEAEEAPPASSERKVSFSQEAGTDSETARAMRKGTGYVPMSQIARLGSDEDTADEVDEIRHVSFSPDTATSNETNASHRKGTGYVQMSDLPDDEDEEGVDEIADKKVSFADAQDPASKNGSQASSTRKGTGYVATRNLPESEDEEDETDEIQAPPGCGERKVSFSQEAGTDSERVQAMRKGTGFVPMRDLPDSDDEDPEDQEAEEAPPASSERKVSFSQEAGTDSETARAMRKGTGYVPMSQIARLASDEDTADEVDEIRHVSFSPDTATSNETNASHRKGTGYVQMSDLPDDEDEEGADEIADKKVSFADAQDPASKNGSQASSTRKGTGYVATQNLPESEDEEDETDEIQAPPGCGERKVSFSQEAGSDLERVQSMRKGTGFVPMRDLPDSDDEDSKVDPEDEEDAYDDEEFEDEEQEA